VDTVPERPWEVDLIVGNCVLVPTAAIRENGLMDAKRFPAFGDAEYTPRLKRNGWTLLVDPGSHVFCLPNTLPKRVRSMALRDLFEALIVDRRQTHNLRRRFDAYTRGGPSRLQGVLAFLVFFARLLIGRNYESRWASQIREPPLAETFSHAMVPAAPGLSSPPEAHGAPGDR
jgi:GT2 family glycosyltransferase